MGCPWPWALVLLADRFKCLPWELEDEPADRVLYYTGLLALEAEYHADTAGMEAAEPFYDEGE